MPRQRAARVRRRTLYGLFALFTIGWFLAVIGISRNMTLPVSERYAGSSMLFLEGCIALIWITDAYSWRHAVRFAAVVLPLAFLVEYVGVRTGIPFGHYHYTGALVPSVLARVPAPITFAWLMIALGALTAAQAYTPGKRSGVVVVVSALLATGLDACLEPTAYHVKAYWLWEEGGPYYGVPILNFIGWFVVALGINALAARVLMGRQPDQRRFQNHQYCPEGTRKNTENTKKDKYFSLGVLGVPCGCPQGSIGGSSFRRFETSSQPRITGCIPVVLFWSTVVMFAIIDFFRGYPGGAALGALLCLTALPALYRAVHQARGVASRTSAPSIHPDPANAKEPNSSGSARKG